jgi:mannose/fructose/N-acetylgalactosamine-specific phosphotransferase system component IID
VYLNLGVKKGGSLSLLTTARLENENEFFNTRKFLEPVVQGCDITLHDKTNVVGHETNPK